MKTAETAATALLQYVYKIYTYKYAHMKSRLRIVGIVEPCAEAKYQAEHHCCSQGTLIQEHLHIVREG